eukprot:285027-Rhodomonas_salina.4
MASTERAYAATSDGTTGGLGAPLAYDTPGTSLRASYAIPGTGVHYGAIALRMPYAIPGTGAP